MKLGIGSYTYGWGCGVSNYPAPSHPLDWRTLLQRAGDMGVSVVQIANNMPLHEIDLDALMEDATQRDIALEAGTRGIDPDHLRQYAQIAQRIGSPILRCVIDTKEHQPDFQEIIKTFKAVLPEFEKCGVTLAIENHDRWLAKTLANLMHVLRHHPIGICLDVANSLGREEPMTHVAHVLAPYTVNLHIKEYTIQRLPSYHGFVIHGAPFGKGMCDLDWLLPYLKKHSKGDYNAILEQWVPAQNTVDETVALEEKWAEESVAYLKSKYFDA
jgi:sugar phosphate isomerase/epimerase